MPVLQSNFITVSLFILYKLNILWLLEIIKDFVTTLSIILGVFPKGLLRRKYQRILILFCFKVFLSDVSFESSNNTNHALRSQAGLI